jgi:hypothetical protein
LTKIDAELFARDIGQNAELTKVQKEAFKQLREKVQHNCREHNQMLGKGSAEEAETIRQHLAQIIIGHGLVVPKPVKKKDQNFTLKKEKKCSHINCNCKRKKGC